MDSKLVPINATEIEKVFKPLVVNKVHYLPSGLQVDFINITKNDTVEEGGSTVEEGGSITFVVHKVLEINVTHSPSFEVTTYLKKLAALIVDPTSNESFAKYDINEKKIKLNIHKIESAASSQDVFGSLFKAFKTLESTMKHRINNGFVQKMSKMLRIYKR